MTPVPTRLVQPTRLERLQELRARLHEFAPTKRGGLLHDLIDICVDQDREIERLKSQLGLDEL